MSRLPVLMNGTLLMTFLFMLADVIMLSLCQNDSIENNILWYNMVLLSTGVMGCVLFYRLFRIAYQQLLAEQERHLQHKLKDQVIHMLEILVPIVERKSNVNRSEIEGICWLMRHTVNLLPGAEVEDWEIRLLALLHYVSRIYWPEYIFDKNTELTDVEYRFIREHSMMAKGFLDKYPSFRQVTDAFTYHHERIDGTGYPGGRREGNISVLAQVLGIAECFIALTTARAYREPLTFTKALEEIRQLSNQAYYPEVVSAFTRALHRIQAKKTSEYQLYFATANHHGIA
ncbi:hypothetical protein GJ688_13540 [Heliobacillus mobilis]|uniref:HD-GYP domain-containing protein n=1 Tax=Heliobacterium mobile TaxID=28064 RepID=A0A6I3SM01_HELMO|nr:HD domain-containing phosphohydrolase [Heliobacterium mobile]MTV49998.1 hypothetical protein [Heliobacterium mobile]